MTWMRLSGNSNSQKVDTRYICTSQTMKNIEMVHEQGKKVSRNLDLT